MSRKVTRQSRVSMERIRAAANSRLMRLAQKMIVGGTLLLDRVANSIADLTQPFRIPSGGMLTPRLTLWPRTPTRMATAAGYHEQADVVEHWDQLLIAC